MSKTKASESGEAALRKQLDVARHGEEHFKRLFDDCPMALWEEDFSLLKKRFEKLSAGGVASFRDYFSRNPQVVVGCISMVTINTVNHAALELFKADRKEFLRYGLPAIYGDKNYEAFSRELIAIAEGRRVFEGEVMTHALTGEVRHVIVKWTVPQAYEDTYSKVLVGALDLTKRDSAAAIEKDLELKARQAERLSSLSDLSGKISHDFNNVLMAILGYSEILRGQLGERTKEYTMIEQIEQAAKRAADMTQQLSICSGKSAPTLAVVIATNVIEDMRSELKGRSLLKAILNFDLKSDLPPIEADASQIRQMVPVLLDNAVEALGDKVGIVTIRTGSMECDAAYLKGIHGGQHLPAGKYVYIEVVDTGHGMDQKILSKLFVPFFTTKSKRDSLDLSIVLGIMKGHNGAIAVTSEPGEGTSFKLLFPVSAKAAAEMKAKAGKPEAWKGKGTILVIDDEPMIRNVMTHMLQTLGFKVITASDGRAGIDVYRKNSKEIVAVLLDVIMPGISSADTFKEIRHINGNACVILSSGASEDTATVGFPAGEIAGFIHKPYQRQELTDTLSKLLEK